jgi:hypothetical protein
MVRSKTLWRISLSFGLLFGGVATGQKALPTTDLSQANASELFGGDSDHWLSALIESKDQTDSSVYLDRLENFHLSASQLDMLCKSASQEESDGKRIVLWQALRQSRDTRSRDVLIKILVHESSVDERIEFIEQMHNLSRSDIPVLIALYNSQRPKKKKIAPSFGEQNALSSNDLLDVPHKIVELACHTEWSSLSTMTGFTYPGDKRQEDRSKWVESMNKRGIEASSAQEDFIFWLIKNGFDDNHQIKAYVAFSRYGSSWDRQKVYANMERELLRGMDSPESLAVALPIVKTRIEPVRYLNSKEANIVRLAAIQAMENKVLYAFSSQIVLSFWDVIALYKPILESAVDSDPSPEVKAAAQRLLDRIAQTEVEYGKAVGRAR